MFKGKDKKSLIIIVIILLGVMISTIIILSAMLYNEKYGAVKTGGGEVVSPSDAVWVGTIRPPYIEYITRYAREPFVIGDYPELFNDDIDKKLLFYDGYYGEVWTNLLTDVPLNPYEQDKFRLGADGYLYYVDGDEIKTMVGIDISGYQNVDWLKVKAAGVEFAIVKVGNRNASSAKLYEDSKYRSHIAGALSVGIKVGVYFYSQALNVEEALEESNFVLDLIEPYEITFPVVYDWEIAEDENKATRSYKAKVEDFTDAAAAFCQNIKKNGYVPMIYSQPRQAYLKYEMSRLKDFEFWLAHWTNDYKTTYAYNFQMWQYQSDAYVDGVTDRDSGLPAHVDLNLSFVDYSGKRKTAKPASSVVFEN